jgi:hypothetical protein
LKAEVLTAWGVLLTFWSWDRLRGSGVRWWGTPEVLRGMHGLWLPLVYGLALGAMLLDAYGTQLGLRSLGQLLVVFMSTGLVCAALVPIAFAERGLPAVLLSVVLVAPFLYKALNLGMKTEFIHALLPTLVVMFWTWRSTWQRAIVVVVLAAAVGVITQYVEFYRFEYWLGKRTTTATEAVEAFLTQSERDAEVSDPTQGVRAFVRRFNIAYERGIAVGQADLYGYEPRLVFEPMVYVLVPRAIWTDKPLIQQGWEYSGLIFGKKTMYWSNSATAAGYYAALYLGLGWTAVVLGALLLGGCVAWVERLMERSAIETRALFSGFMAFFALRVEESWPVGALPVPIITAIYVALLGYGAGVLVRSLAARRADAAQPAVERGGRAAP